MARRGDGNNTAGSQFFIMHSDHSSLDGQYAAFGRVTDEASMAVVDMIATTKTDANDKPLTEWRIKTITVDTHGVTYEPAKLQ
jgi:peptidyl-prolyl cis-trans isomerase B (cyclophilin B)